MAAGKVVKVRVGARRQRYRCALQKRRVGYGSHRASTAAERRSKGTHHSREELKDVVKRLMSEEIR